MCGCGGVSALLRSDGTVGGPRVLGGPSPAAVLSLPTGVLEQLRSMVDDPEDTAPGLQPVCSTYSSGSVSSRLGGP